MLKKIHEPSRNNTAEMTGIPHNLFMFLPAKTPIITEYIGFTAKYSLQGTTQGNGLTGSILPVRFSM